MGSGEAELAKPSLFQAAMPACSYPGYYRFTSYSHDFRYLPFRWITFGDYPASGTVFAMMVKKHLIGVLGSFRDSGKLIIGTGNGFQILVKIGILPGIGGKFEQEVSLVNNESGKFINRWVRLRVNPRSSCVWTEGLSEIELPVRHGEGRFITAQKILQKL